MLQQDANEAIIKFWSHYLHSSRVVMGPRLKYLVQIALILPVGSSEAERGFSIMNHIRYDRRSRLTPQHLEDLLRKNLLTIYSF